tara:strand:- start:706 stop:1431 length:726 start_codon:yes stop_codon:yes gene_type:complete
MIVINILAIKDGNYLKLAINNINSYHKLDKHQKFNLYLDEVCLGVYKQNVSKLTDSDNVTVKIIETDKYWQYAKILIFEDFFQKEDFIIIDADSLWYSLPTISDDKITYLSESHKINKGPNNINDYNDLSKFIEGITPEMTNNQIGFLSIPKILHSRGLIEEWFDLCDKIENSNEVREDINRQCEQLSISLLTQMKKIPFLFLKEIEGLNNKNIVESLYWSCRGKGSGPGQHQTLLKKLGW